ncbi:MAG: methylenetetrahydrofolate reductase [Acidimicrobiaceae bacterium]|nr:methylenetetrahydrofolate reductase [Acidimicrobiaceae bacterium]
MSSEGTSEIVRRLVRTANLEVIPMKGTDEKLGVVPASTRLTITMSPKFGLERTLQYVEIGRKAGHEVVPHLAARQVKDVAELKDFVGRANALGVTDLYVIGGDAEEPAGDFTSAAELLEALKEVDHTLERIGVGCYPEGHPLISDEVLLDALKRKQPMAHYMVSQLCFDEDALVNWLRKMRSSGITLPLRIGLAAPMNARKLMELSVRIGVGQSLKYLTKQHGFVRNMLFGSSYRPEKMLQKIGQDLGSSELNIEGIHLFSFNQIAPSVEWQQRVAGTDANQAA